MRGKFFHRLLCGLSLLPLLYLSPAAADSSAAAKSVKAAEGTQARGTLYRVRHQGNTSWLFGTIHVGKSSFYPLEPRVSQAFDQAGRLVVEVDIRDTGAVVESITRFGMYGNGDTLEKRVAPVTVEQLRKTLQKYGMPFETVAGMKPWMAANLLIALDLESNGLSATQGVDMHLLKLAGQQTKAVEQLETADYQFSLFDALPPRQQEQYLREMLGELGSGKITREMLDLMTAWGKADSASFERALRQIEQDKTFAAEFTRTVLLDKRNEAMTNKVEALLKQGKSNFVAVGLLHLIGKTGLPALLKQRGYEVEKVY